MKKIALLLLLVLFAFPASHAFADSATIRPGDTFDLRIGGVPPDDTGAISSSYTVDGEGYINLPYIGRVMVARLTPSAIQSNIEHAYVSQGIFTHPTITLSIAPAARFVNVSGQVRAPQRVPYTPDMTVLSAINAAGDFNEFADQKKVHLVRNGSVRFVNCAKARGTPELDEKVLPGDQIMVSSGFW